ncbi:hypothetical protein FXO38_33188 [Capsicum annuum]|nr:hypothetical protein FXO38_33188 [Capsicum annuum]KAF3668174.1 hypothetical protein FXO37_09661 [Capsicum annuum]
MIVIDPYVKTFAQNLEYDWAPQYYTKCLKIGHLYNKEKDFQVIPPKRKRKMQQTVRQWQYKGPVQPASYKLGEPSVIPTKDGQPNQPEIDKNISSAAPNPSSSNLKIQ